MLHTVDFNKAKIVTTEETANYTESEHEELLGGYHETEMEAWKSAFLALRKRIFQQAIDSFRGKNE